MSSLINGKVKGMAKRIVKKIATKVIAAPLLVKILVLLVAALAVCTLFDWFTEIFAGEKTAKTIYSDLDVQSVVELVEIKGNAQNGYYLDFKDGIDEKLKGLLDKFSSETGYKKFPDSVDFLKKMLKAEIYTNFPNLGGNIPEDTTGFQGAITIRRITPNKASNLSDGEQEIDTKVTNLKYIDIKTFDNYIDEGNSQVLSYFSLDKENQLITASNSGNGYTKNASVDFQTALQKYVMPYEYLMFFWLDSRSEEFCSKLAEEALKSKFIIAVQDDMTVTNTKIETQRKEDANPSNFSKNWYVSNTKNEETISYSTSIEPTYVETWYIKVRKENDFNVNMENKDSINTKIKCKVSNYNDGPNESEEKLKETKTVKVNSNVDVEYKIYEKTKTTIHTTNVTINSGDKKIDPKLLERKFVKLYKDCKMEDSVIDHRLFTLIEKNAKTANLLDLTKYLIYKATGENYGVKKKDLDFSEYELDAFSSIEGIYGDTIQEKVWFALRNAGYSEIATAAVMGNIANESGFDPDKIEQGNNIGYGLCQWSFGRRKSIEKYAKSKGAKASDIEIQIEFLLAELTPGGGANGYASYQLGGASSTNYDGKSYTRNDWLKAKDIDIATMAFMAIFERPSYNSEINHISKRREDAKKYYNEFKGKTIPEGGSATAAKGDGYSKIYTSSIGKIYKEYKQYEGSYANKMFEYYHEPMSSSGCSITAIAVILSGYGSNKTPEDLRKEVPNLANIIRKNGVSCTDYSKADKSKMMNGKPMLVSISGTLRAGGSSKYYEGHYIAILDAKGSDQVYVSDVGSSKTTGWANVNDIISIVNRGIIYITQK